MKRKVKNKRFNKKLIILFLLLLLILLVIILNRNKIKDKLVPIYKLEDKTGNVEKYKKKYKDTVGWIKVQGTNIDIPISSKDFSSLKNFAWINGSEGEFEDYLPVFGHNFINVGSQPIVGGKNLSRFEQLMSFVYGDFADKNKYFQITIGGKNYLYQIYGVSFLQDGEVRYNYNSVDKSNKAEFIKDSKKNSIYDYDVDVSTNDSLASLYTCTRLFGPYSYYIKVDGKLVKNSNKGYNYDMHEKRNYKEIKKILEGDGEDV